MASYCFAEFFQRGEFRYVPSEKVVVFASVIWYFSDVVGVNDTSRNEGAT